MIYKLGRLKRTYNPTIPCMSVMRGISKPIVLPKSVDYSKGMPASLGMMMNDTLGDCTCAAYGHALQVWSWNATKKMITEPDIDILKLYEGACGYNPKDPNTDQGGIEQNVLGYLLKTGCPTGMHAETRHKIRAFVEVDFRNIEDVKRAIYECGCLYVGFDVPANIVPDYAEPPSVWDVQKNSEIVGGHAIIIVGYNPLKVISWGKVYEMTVDFFNTYMDESYALCDIDWFTSTGKTLLGRSISELSALMKSFKVGA